MWDGCEWNRVRVECIRVRVVAEWIREDGYECVMGWQVV